MQFSMYIHVPWVNSPPKLVFKESFVLPTRRWGYHHSPCDSLSLLLRHTILTTIQDIRNDNTESTYNDKISILKTNMDTLDFVCNA